MFAYLSQTRLQGGLFRRTDTIGKELSNSPSPLSPDNNLLAMHAAEATTEQVWFTHSPVRLSLRSEMWPANTNDSAVPWQSRRLPAFSLQASVSIERHLSRIFPVLPSVTRFGPYPAPVGTARLCFYGIQKIFVQRTQKHFPNLPKKTPLGTRERGTLASLRA
jgi:hypothetical protein